MPKVAAYKKDVGSGRFAKNAQKDYEQWLIDTWAGLEDGKPLDIAKIDELIKSGKYGAKDISRFKILKGDPFLLQKILDKVLPDKLDMTSLGENINAPANVAKHISAILKKAGITGRHRKNTT